MAANGSSDRVEITCGDVRRFKETLKTLRAYDDKIIYKLNQSVPTQSFQHEIHAEEKCKSLYQDLLEIYKLREDGIKKCISERTEQIQILQKQLQGNPNNNNIEKQIRSVQTTLRIVQNELMVENVVKTRSMKVFNERCWKAYTPPS